LIAFRLVLQPPPPPSPFPYTTLFRSVAEAAQGALYPFPAAIAPVGGIKLIQNLNRKAVQGAFRNVQCGQPLLQQGGNRRKIFHRSEEHTSELQSRFDLVCRLLLEKKN